MDALTALGVASNVISIIDFGTKLIEVCVEAHSAAKDASQKLKDIKYLTTGLRDAAQRLSYQQIQPLSYCARSPLHQDNELHLLEISRSCEKIAQELLDHVAPFTTHDTMSTLVRTKVILSFLKDRITHGSDQILRRLMQHKSQLETHILLSIRYETIEQAMSSTAFSERFDQHEKMIIRGFERGETHFSQILTSFESLRKDLDQSILNDGNRTRAMIAASSGIQMQRDDHVKTNEQNGIEHLLKALWYQNADRRLNEIEVAHPGTCEWILKDEGINGRPSLLGWLKGDYETMVFWIAGKPGAGKSTLMKFLLSSSAMNGKFTERWASRQGCSEYIAASHFFWQQGAMTQKTVTGMLRSLLYQILSQIGLSQSLLLSRVEQDSIESNGRFDWYTEKLLIMFDKLWTETDPRIIFYLFIDGLDECADDHESLIQALQVLIRTGRNRVRIIAASRSWAVFIDKLQLSNLASVVYIHQFSASDVTRYAVDQLCESSIFTRLYRDSPQDAEALFGDIEKKANGVFAWVKLAVKQVRNCLRKGVIDLCLLLKEVERLPEELASLYDHVLDRIEESQRGRCTMMLQLFQFKEEHLRDWRFEGDPDFFVACLLLSEVSLVNRYKSSRTGAKLNDLISEFEVILESATGGLLECSSYQLDELKMGSVTMLHSTAIEWLDRSATQARLAHWSQTNQQCLVSTYFNADHELIHLRTEFALDEHDVFALIKRALELLFMLDPLDSCVIKRFETLCLEWWTSFREEHSQSISLNNLLLGNTNMWLGLCICLTFDRAQDLCLSTQESYHSGSSYPTIKWETFWHEMGLQFDIYTCLITHHINQANDLFKISPYWKLNFLPFAKHDHCAIAFSFWLVMQNCYLQGSPDFFLFGGYPKDWLYHDAVLHRVDPKFIIPGTCSSIWEMCLIQLNEQFRTENLKGQGLIRMAKIFLRNGAPELECTKMYALQRCPSVPVLRASEYVHPNLLRSLCAEGLFSGPIPTVSKWAEARINHLGPLSLQLEKFTGECWLHNELRCFENLCSDGRAGDEDAMDERE